MSIQGMIDERLRQVMAEALAPLVARLEELEKRLEIREPTVSGDKPEPEDKPEPAPPSEPVRKRAPRNRSSTSDREV